MSLINKWSSSATVTLLFYLPTSMATISSSAQDESLFVKEVLLTGLGYKNRRPMLIAVVEQDLLVYEGFQFMESSLEGHLNLRFRKVQQITYTELEYSHLFSLQTFCTMINLIYLLGNCGMSFCPLNPRKKNKNTGRHVKLHFLLLYIFPCLIRNDSN